MMNLLTVSVARLPTNDYLHFFFVAIFGTGDQNDITCLSVIVSQVPYHVLRRSNG